MMPVRSCPMSPPCLMLTVFPCLLQGDLTNTPASSKERREEFCAMGAGAIFGSTCVGILGLRFKTFLETMTLIEVSHPSTPRGLQRVKPLRVAIKPPNLLPDASQLERKPIQALIVPLFCKSLCLHGAVLDVLSNWMPL